MAKLTGAERKKIPGFQFGLPKTKQYPMPDKSHAGNAKARASEEASKGKLSAADEKKIDSKADAILGKK